MGTGQCKLFADRVNEEHPGFDVEGMANAIDLELDL
jgi:hypothetical protein